MPDLKKGSAKVFWVVTALVVAVLTFVLIHLTRLLMAVRLSDLIESRSFAVSAGYLAITGGLWAAAGILVVWRLLRRDKYALLSLKLIAAGYSINYWVEQLWMAQSDLRSINWTFSAGLNILLLLLLFIILSHPFVRNIFGDRNG